MQVSKNFLTSGAAALGLMAFTTVAVNAATEEQLREALRQRLATESGGQPVAAKPAPAAPAAAKPPAASAAKAAPVVTAAPTAVAAPNTFVDDATTARLREALRQSMEAPTAASGASGAASVPIVDQAVAEAEARQKAGTQAQSTPASAAAAATTGVQPQPLATPASPIPAGKQQRLAELLTKYKADQITPHEYHRQRASILAE